MPPDPSFRVRAARPTDAPSLTLLLNTVIAAGGTTAMETPLTEAEFADYFLTGADVFSCVVAEDVADDALLGFQAVCRYPDLPEGWGISRPSRAVRRGYRVSARRCFR